jgi:uncharacterized membrane protein YfcA
MSFPLPLPELPWLALAAIPLIVLLAYTVFGATGFGSSLIGVPLLAHLLPLTFAVPFITLLDAAAATAQGVRLRRDTSWPVFRRLLPAILVGIAIGATLLVALPQAPLLLALGIFVSGYGVYLLLGTRKLRTAPDWLAYPIGLVGGIFSVTFGTGGPIYMVFLSARIHDKSVLRATSSMVVTVSVWIRIVVFLAVGLLLHPPLLTTALLMVPVMILGLVIGNRLHHALTGSGFMRFLALLFLGNGISLLIRAAKGLVP